jgi:hypothetical protein
MVPFLFSVPSTLKARKGFSNFSISNPAAFSDCHGSGNPYGLWVGYAGVGVRVALYRPFVYPHPQRGLAVYPSKL